MAKKAKYPYAKVAICKICDRFCTVWVTQGKEEGREICGKTCRNLARSIGLNKATEIRKELEKNPPKARRSTDSIPAPSSYEEQLWNS